MKITGSIWLNYPFNELNFMSEAISNKEYSLLVIEDNAGDFYLIREYLEERDFTGKIARAKNFSDAEKLLNNGDHSFDAILLDLTLPDLSGEELIKRITGLEGDAVTIALTGYSDMEFSVKSLGLGISDYLLKDELTSNGLWKSIRYSLERKASSESLKESEERYRDLFQNNPNPLIVWDLKTEKIVDFNRQSIEKYGYSADEFRQLSLDDIEADKYKGPDKKAFDKENEGAIRLHQTKNRETFFAEINYHRIDYDESEACLIIINDISEKLEMQEKMIESAVRAEEEERNRIAKDLHDGIMQQLVACGMFAQNLRYKIGEDEKLEKEIDNLYALIRNLTNETRDISHNLKSAEFELTSLADLTEQLTRQLSRDSKIDFNFKNHLSFDDNFDPEFKKHVYRILQELCSNVIKHSQGSSAVISIEIIRDRLFLSVVDDGIGFEELRAQQDGIGLRNIKSRVNRLKGEIEFEKQQPKGMQIHIELPVVEWLDS